MLEPLEVLNFYRVHDYTLTDAYESRMPANDRPFVVYRGRSWSRGEFQEAYLLTAILLVSRGIKHGDRVGVMARNHIGHLLVLFACARIGAVMVPANPELKVTEVGYIFQDAGVSAVFCDEQLLDLVKAACSELAPAPWLLPFESKADAPCLMGLVEAKPQGELPEPARADDTCIIIYTSGTTGFPKGAMHSQRTFVTSGEANVARLWLQPDEKVLTVLPLFHINALFYSLAGTLAAGATIIVVEKFSASNFWQLAVDTGATQVNLILTIGLILKERPRSEFRPEHRIRVVYGARPEEEACFRDEFGIQNLVNGFGMTEIPGIICNPYIGQRKFGSLGPVGCHPDPAKPWAECRIVNDEGKDLGPDQVGELWVKHPIVMQGYFRAPEQTRESFDGDWFKTGDLMRRDADGYFYFVTRKKDIIRRRGENIAGAEIDRVLASHPDILEAAAVPVPSEMGDEEILAAVVLREGASPTPLSISQWCANRMSAMKAPRFILFVDQLPHTPTFKVAKHILKTDPTLKSRAVDVLALATDLATISSEKVQLRRQKC
jgi:crotonobetaine/carnitine-CoA ligase